MAGAAKLRLCLICLVLYVQAFLLAHCSQLKLQSVRRAARREQARRAVQQSASNIPNIASGALLTAAPDVSAEDFLGACNFTTAELPGEPVKWHTASSACNILGKLDRLVLVGDSLTRQVWPALLQDKTNNPAATFSSRPLGGHNCLEGC